MQDHSILQHFGGANSTRNSQGGRESRRSVGQQFCSSGQQTTKEFFKKSYAQVASSVAHDVAQVVQHRSVKNSAGRSPRPQKVTAQCTHGVRLKAGELGVIRDKAARLNLSVNAYIRAAALGENYIEKPPSWLRDVLLQFYVELSRQGNNLNQMARSVNAQSVSAEQALGVVDRQRAPLFQLMEKVELALAGRRPPHDY